MVRKTVQNLCTAGVLMVQAACGQVQAATALGICTDGLRVDTLTTYRTGGNTIGPTREQFCAPVMGLGQSLGGGDGDYFAETSTSAAIGIRAHATSVSTGLDTASASVNTRLDLVFELTSETIADGVFVDLGYDAILATVDWIQQSNGTAFNHVGMEATLRWYQYDNGTWFQSTKGTFTATSFNQTAGGTIEYRDRVLRVPVGTPLYAEMRLGAGVSSRGGLDGTSGMISSAAASLTLALTMAFTPPESTAIEWAVTETLGLPGPALGMVTPVPLPAAIWLMAAACVVLATGGRLPGGGLGANGTRRRSCAASG